MKKLAICFVLLVTCTGVNVAFAEDDNLVLQNYSAVKEALITGDNLSVVTDFSKCKGSYPISTIGGMRVHSFLVLTDPKTKSEFIAFSDYHQRLKDTDTTPQVEFIHYRVTPDNNVTVKMSRYPSSTPKTHMYSAGYTCPINSGIKFYLSNGDLSSAEKNTKQK